MKVDNPIAMDIKGSVISTVCSWIWDHWWMHASEGPDMGAVTTSIPAWLTVAPAVILQDNLWHNPAVPGDCFYEALSFAAWGVPAGRAMRRLIARRWRSPTNRSYLEQIANDEAMSCGAYIAAISRWMWGGRPEARVFANHMPVAIWCWSPGGTLVYKEAGYADSWGNACPVINIHLGLYARHYVLLKDAPSALALHEGVQSGCRAGGPRSRIRVRIFPRSQVADRQSRLRLRSRARQVTRSMPAALPPLPRRKRPRQGAAGVSSLEAVQQPEAVVVEPTPVRVEVQPDSRPPLPRRRRVQQGEGQSVVPAPDSQASSGVPRGPNDLKIQSRSKFLISLENFNLDVSNSPQKIGPRWVARSKISFSLEIFNLARISNFFDLWAPSG